MVSMEINLQAVLDYIANTLYTNIHYYNPASQAWITSAQKLAVPDPYFAKPEIRTWLLSDAMSKSDVSLAQVNTTLFYSPVRCAHGSYVIGPVQLPSDIQCENQLDIYPETPDFIQHVLYVPLTLYVENLLLLYNLFHQDPMTQDVFASLGQYHSKANQVTRQLVVKLSFDNREEQLRHNPFDNEIRNLKAIEEGRIDQFDLLWRDNYNFRTLPLLSRDEGRATQYVVIMSVALASRAAIRGGVLPEVALSLCDSYVRQIDEIRDIRQLESLARDAWISFAYLALESRNSKSQAVPKPQNPTITRCKEYVFLHLQEKITINQIADELNLNPTYLTNLFKTREGISLYQFILNEKINLVKNMLIYSSHSYIDIANYLGFSSQSHLGQVFKRATGMSLRQYRNMYGK